MPAEETVYKITGTADASAVTHLPTGLLAFEGSKRECFKYAAEHLGRAPYLGRRED